MTVGRTQARVVLLLTALCVLRGVFWAVVAIAPSPIDEMQHFDYVHSIATGDGVPTVGKDRIHPDVLSFAKASPTFGLRSQPYPGDTRAPEWDGADPQYEGIQGPTYYALLAPFYWLGRLFGIGGSFYLVRVGSVLLGALAIPASWLLIRRLLPRRPETWLLPPVALTFVNAVSAGAATIGNDVVVLTGAAVAAIVLLRGLERRSTAAAVGAGAAAGLVLLGKTTAGALVPVLGLLALPWLRRWWAEGPDSRLLLRRWVVAYGAAFAAPFALWTAWNLWTYHAFSGAAEADAITGALQTTYPRTFETVRVQWEAVRRGLTTAQIADLEPAYHHVWELGFGALVGCGLVLAWRRRDRESLLPLGWGTLAYPLTFATVAGSFLLVLGETGILLGRYLWVALVPLAIALGVGAFVLGGRRFALALVLVVAAVATWYERTDAHRFLDTYYEYELAGGDLGPVVEQSWNDGYTPAAAIEIDVDCQVAVVDLGLEVPPERIEVVGAEGSTGATLEQSRPAAFTRYRLDTPVHGPLTIPVTTGVAISVTERAPEASLDGAAGDPMVRAHCPVDDPGDVRFEQLFDRNPPVPRSLLELWPTLNAIGVTVAAAAAVLWGLRRRELEG